MFWIRGKEGFGFGRYHLGQRFYSLNRSDKRSSLKSLFKSTPLASNLPFKYGNHLEEIGDNYENHKQEQKVQTQAGIEEEEEEAETRITASGGSYVDIGRDYEERCAYLLQRPEYGFRLTQTGGKDDRGIDLKGIWAMANNSQVIVQCKRYHHRKLGVAVVREFEGVLGRQEEGTVGILASSIGITRQSQQYLLSSKYPLIFALVDCSNFMELDRVRRMICSRSFHQLFPNLVITAGNSDGGGAGDDGRDYCVPVYISNNL